MITTIIEYMIKLMEQTGYFGLAFAVMLESFVAIIPSGAILPFAGFLVGEGKLNMSLVVLVAGFSSYIGTLPFYLIGLIWDREKIFYMTEKYGKYIFIELEEVKKAFAMFDKHDKPLLFFGRMIPIVRSLISLPAGIARMNFWQFSLYTISGACLWSAIAAMAGYFLGKEWEVFGYYLDRYENFWYAIIALICLVFVFYKVRSVKKKKSENLK